MKAVLLSFVTSAALLVSTSSADARPIGHRGHSGNFAGHRSYGHYHGGYSGHRYGGYYGNRYRGYYGNRFGGTRYFPGYYTSPYSWGYPGYGSRYYGWGGWRW